MADKLLTTAQAAKILGVSFATTSRWDSEGLLTSQRTHGGHRRFDSRALPGVIGKTQSPRNARKACPLFAYGTHLSLAIRIRSHVSTPEATGWRPVQVRLKLGKAPAKTASACPA